jgi:hypothetical protein
MCLIVRHGAANFSSDDSSRFRLGFAFTGWSVEGDPVGSSFRHMKQLCCIPQPDDSSRHCILFHQHTGPHQTFVAEWKDGDANSRRRPALHFRKKQTNTRPSGMGGNRVPGSQQPRFRLNAARAR